MKNMYRILMLGAIMISAFGLLAAPAQEAAAQTTSCTQTHTVQPGENLFRIGLRYGVSWTTLQQWNNLSNPNVVYVGQVLCVSGPVAPGDPPDFGTGGPSVVYPGNPFGPTTEPRIWFPQVTLAQSFQLRGYNFPPNRQVTIAMTTLGNRPYVPYYLANTDASGEFYVSITIPAELATAGTVAVEATTTGGYYARNWFYNR
ncbi:MAG: LysM peptidoglycan-binding domain-containing protein [Chloroflexi bacterium]|nr:LysM peptidoglycan-binding domain-containing protein [Chloroflexota bacterium]